MKYLIVEKGYEYNDEYNITSDSYSLTDKKLYNSKEEAQTGINKWILNQFKDYKGKFNSSNFDFKQFDYADNLGKIENYFRKNKYPIQEDDYQLTLPSGLSEEQVLEAWSYFRKI